LSSVFLIPRVNGIILHSQDYRRPCLPHCHCKTLEHATTGDHVIAVTADFQVCTEDGIVSQIVQHTSGSSSIDTSLIRDVYCGPEVLFETCVAMKYVDDDDDDSIMLFLFAVVFPDPLSSRR